MDQHGARDERGHALSVFVVTVVAALILMAGLVVDGGAQSAATRRAEQVASQAARAAMDAGATSRIGGAGTDAAAMYAAAQGVLGASGMDGSVTITGDAVLVRTRTSTPTVFLSLAGIGSLPARGEATAVLRATGDR